MDYQADDLKNALTILQQGGVILYPTDTIWGLGCDATNEEAVRRIFQIKQLSDSKALILLIDSLATLRRYVPIDNYPADIMTALIPYLQPLSPNQKDQSTIQSDHSTNHQIKPTTIIYPQVTHLPDFLKASDSSVAIRITREAFSRDLCAALGHPLVSTSANISGQPSPQFFGQISPHIRSAADYICTYRQDDLNPAQPSTILQLSQTPDRQFSFHVIRP